MCKSKPLHFVNLKWFYKSQMYKWAEPINIFILCLVLYIWNTWRRTFISASDIINLCQLDKKWNYLSYTRFAVCPNLVKQPVSLSFYLFCLKQDSCYSTRRISWLYFYKLGLFGIPVTEVSFLSWETEILRF